MFYRYDIKLGHCVAHVVDTKFKTIDTTPFDAIF